MTKEQKQVLKAYNKATKALGFKEEVDFDKDDWEFYSAFYKASQEPLLKYIKALERIAAHQGCDCANCS